MFTFKGKKGYCQDLHAVIENSIPPAKLPTLKIQRIATKVSDKLLAAIPDIASEQESLQEKVKEFQRVVKDVSEEEKEKLTKESNAEVQKLVDHMNELRNETVEVELSDDQIEFLRSNFEKTIAPAFNKIRYVLEIAEALEVPEAKE